MKKLKECLISENEQPTMEDLIDRLNNCQLCELISYYLVTNVNETLFSFLCGITACFPVTVLLNLIDLKVRDSFFNLVSFSIYVLLAFFGAMINIKLIKFTLLHIKIYNQVASEPNKEGFKNKRAAAFLESSSKIASALKDFIGYSFFFIMFLILHFIAVNIIK